MKAAVFLACVCCVSVVTAFVGSEDKFIKKYAMMKIYESCFGSDVVRQIRREMKAACAKCAAYEAPPSTTPAPPPPTEEPPQGDAQAPGGPNQPDFDVAKLHEAIMAYRPNMPQPGFRPGGYSNNFFSPMAFSNPNIPAGGYPFFYPGLQQVPFSPYGNFPIVGQQFYSSGNRMSRDMDLKGEAEVIVTQMGGKIKNVTCVMQELGYLDENLEPNYSKISERIGNLPVGEDLKRDMQDGVTFCQQFSQCVPDVKKEKTLLSREFIRPMFFFKCYKHKKLEACVMKDVREKFASVTEEDFESGDVELRRQGKSRKLDNEDNDIENMAASMYEFLYASDSGFDIDGIL